MGCWRSPRRGIVTRPPASPSSRGRRSGGSRRSLEREPSGQIGDGLFRLWGESYEPRDHVNELFRFILETENHEQVLDCVELCARLADRFTRKWDYLHEQTFDARVDRAVEELNQRFKEHGVGYQYEAGDLVRVDSDLLRSEAVKPALTLLKTKRYEGPREEFLRAHEHYRHGRHEESLTESLKAFESTMKAICDAKKWSYDRGATAKKLVEVCFKNGLIDPFWQTHIAHLQGTLENGIATARNKLGGHGQGSQPREVPREIVSYVLHMVDRPHRTASVVVRQRPWYGGNPMPTSFSAESATNVRKSPPSSRVPSPGRATSARIVLVAPPFT